MNCQKAFQINEYLDNCMTNRAPQRAAQNFYGNQKLYLTYEGLVCLNQME